MYSNSLIVDNAILSISKVNNGFIVMGPQTGDRLPGRWAFETLAALTRFISDWGVDQEEKKA